MSSPEMAYDGDAIMNGKQGRTDPRGYTSYLPTILTIRQDN